MSLQPLLFGLAGFVVVEVERTSVNPYQAAPLMPEPQVGGAPRPDSTFELVEKAKSGDAEAPRPQRSPRRPAGSQSTAARW